ncbi:MAG: T9SS type A sorting domain-containing protein [Saprospiraceae bacterium]
MNTLRFLMMLTLLFTNSLSSQTLPPHTLDFRGLWVTDFRTEVLGNLSAENELLEYAVANDFNYLICTNIFQILTANCTSFTSEMMDLQAFIEKAHTVYNIQYISGNVGTDATASKIQDYNNCSTVTDAQKFDMITYECEFYNSSSNASCSNFTSYFSQLQNIRTICDSTAGSDPSQHLVCEVYIGGAGSTGNVLTNSSQPEMQQIAALSDHILITYYRSDPFQSGGNFFNWTISRLEWLASPGDLPNKIVLLLKSRETDTNNMHNYLLTYGGTHFDALRDPYHAWVEGTAYNSSLTKGYIASYMDGTYLWLSGIQVVGFTWFEHLANLEISDTLTSSISVLPTDGRFTTYPNPAQLTITVNEIPVDHLELWNMSGNLLRKENNKSISVVGLPNGLYLLKIKTKDRLFLTKVMVQY